MYKIKYLVTGHVFLLPEKDALELKERFPADYQVLEKDGKKVRDKVREPEKTIDMRNIKELVIDKEEE